MRVIQSAGCVAAIAWAALGLPPAPLAAESPPSPKVLILNSYDQETPPHAAVRDIFIVELQEKYDEPIRFVQFDLQKRGRSGRDSAALQAQLLRNLYGDAPPDLVAAIGPPATEFWLTHRGRIFPDVPMVASGSELRLKSVEPRPGDAVVADRWTYREVVDNILNLLPDTRHILVVFGSSQHERRLTELAKEELQVLADRVAFRFTNDLSLAALQQQLAQLGPGAVVLFGILDSDANGLVLGAKSAFAVVRSASPVPVFGFFDDQLGQGIVGGPLIQLQLSGTELANSAVDILHGRPPRETFRILPISTPSYDWRELDRWEIASSALPPGSIVEFESAPPWRAYALWIILAAVVLLGQTALVLALLVQRQHRRAAEERNATLGRRLISAREDEQRRLARELHDDLSQRLARLAIDAGYLAANPGAEAAGEVARNMQPELARIGKDVHDLSYRLHPSMVDDLGIVAALRNEAERTRSSSGVTVVERIADVSRGIPRDTALAVYRIAQEALRNAVRYGSPKTIELALEKDTDLLTLTVRDDGSGFDVNDETMVRGLGLYSMRERARQLSGSLNVRSRPGAGTTVIAAIPLTGSAA